MQFCLISKLCLRFARKCSIPSRLAFPAFSGLAIVCAFAASAAPIPLAEQPDDDTSRLARRAALVESLLEENAVDEALAEAKRLRAEPFWIDGTLDSISKRLENAKSAPAANPPGGFSAGSALARAVVSFYRFAVSPAIGARCALEPSCSQYFLIASRKHGFLGIPMIADRFIREPVASGADRPVVRNAAGALKHPDPVEDHDWWFAK